MTTSVIQILILILGLFLTFFGLTFYKGFVKLLGFAVGAGYGIYLFSVFVTSIDSEEIAVYLIAGLLILVLGVVGTYLAQFANIVMFFLAGGLVGVLLGKVVMGVPTDEVVDFLNFQSFLQMIKPEGTDIIWFLGGGFVFILSIDILIMFSLGVLGTGLIWYTIEPWDLMQPSWVIPAIIGVLGLMVQEAMRRRAKFRAVVPKIHAPLQRLTRR